MESTPAVTDDAVEECLSKKNGSRSSAFPRPRVGELGEAAGVVTRVLVPALVHVRRRVRRGAVAPGKEQGGAFHGEETLTDTGEEKRGKKNT